MLATNAGGSNVLAYGMARQLTLGIEAVLPNGDIVRDLRNLHKDNSGYDIKDLLIGSEGTLGIITAASLKISYLPKSKVVSFVAVASFSSAIEFLVYAREFCGSSITAFEIMPHIGLELLHKHAFAKETKLFDKEYPWYILIELSTPLDMSFSTNIMLQLCDVASSRGYIKDAIFAQSLEQANFLWKLRHNMSEVQKHEGVSIKHDISLPISELNNFVNRAEVLINELLPGSRIVCFGHLGDGNLHYNILQPEDADGSIFIKQWRKVNAEVHKLVNELGGSFSAEHGVGQLKREEMTEFKDEVSLELMKSIKRMIDPKNIMNPNKIFKY